MKTVLPLLSERMKQVLNMVSECETAADIGCDHGYVAIRLIELKKARHVIASDVNEGPLKRAAEHIREFGLIDRIETRISDGLTAYAPGEAQSAVIAGMGGRLVCSILEKSPAVAGSMRELVLQPQSELSFVRAWLREHGFRIEAEDMIEEEGKFYPMMRVVNGSGAAQNHESCANDHSMDRLSGDLYRASRSAEELLRIQDRYGPCLLEARHPILARYLEKERGTCEEILRALNGASEKQRARREEIAQRLRDIKVAEEYMKR